MLDGSLYSEGLDGVFSGFGCKDTIEFDFISIMKYPWEIRRCQTDPQVNIFSPIHFNLQNKFCQWPSGGSYYLKKMSFEPVHWESVSEFV